MLQGGKGAMPAYLSHLAEAQAGLMGGGEGGAAEAVGAVGAHSLDARLLGQLGQGRPSPSSWWGTPPARPAATGRQPAAG